MLTWSMSAVLKSISFWAALAAVPVAATIARPRTNCRRLRAPFSNWLTRLEMIASMTTPFSSGGKLRLHIIEHAAVFAIEHAAVFAPCVYHVLKANWTSANPTCEIPKEVYPAKRRVRGYTARWTFRVHWWCDVPRAFSYAGLRKVWDNLSDAK